MVELEEGQKWALGTRILAKNLNGAKAGAKGAATISNVRPTRGYPLFSSFCDIKKLRNILTLFNNDLYSAYSFSRSSPLSYLVQVLSE